jgi:Family of unknown function (DUF6210)
MDFRKWYDKYSIDVQLVYNSKNTCLTKKIQKCFFWLKDHLANTPKEEILRIWEDIYKSGYGEKATFVANKNILLDINIAVREGSTALIIHHPTGVEYEAQAGGLLCNHPTCEGFVIDLRDFAQEFNDCAYICADDSPEIQQRLAHDLDLYFKENRHPFCHNVDLWSITFDYSRIEELQEGWWPVIVTGKLSGGILATEIVKWIGYIHTGNCD